MGFTLVFSFYLKIPNNFCLLEAERESRGICQKKKGGELGGDGSIGPEGVGGRVVTGTGGRMALKGRRATSEDCGR